MGGVGGYRRWVNTKVYQVVIHDRWGNAHFLYCFGMDEVTGPIADFDVRQIAGIFPELNVQELVRPSGLVDMLIGQDYIGLHPVPVATVGGLQLCRSLFGWSIRGIPPKGMKVESIGTSISCNNVSFIVDRDDLRESLDILFQIESSGIQAPALEFKPSPSAELELIERGSRYDEEKSMWITSYPWVKDPQSLPNNYTAALGRLRSTEKMLANDDHAKAYCTEMANMVERGVARKLTKSEVKCFTGPVHYIAHFFVLRPDSASTPLRIVYDPSTKFMGFQLNSFWAKGPNIVQSLFAVLLRFRRDVVGIAGAISKMYHSVGLEEKEQHVHRFLWRDMDTERSPDHYVLQTVTFGDRCSGILATTAMQFTGRMFQSEYP